MAVEFGKWQKIERKELTPPIPVGVEKIEIIFTTYGSKNDGSGAMNNEGMVYGGKYSFKISYANNTPPATKSIVWEFSYKTRDGNLVLKSFDGPIFNCDNLDYCGQTISFYAYVKNKQTTKAKLDVFCHYRFKWIDRNKLEDELKERTEGNINQGTSSLCGIAVIGHFLAIQKFDLFKKIILELHRIGKTKIPDTGYEIVIDDDEHLTDLKPTDKNYPLNNTSGEKISFPDFIFLCSIRDYLNNIFDYDTESDLNSFWNRLVEGSTGITYPYEVKFLMEKVLNYSIIKDKSRILTSSFNDVEKSVNELQQNIRENYSIALLISVKNFEENVKPFPTFPDHWVGLKDIRKNTIKQEVSLTVFSWGDTDLSWIVSYDAFKDGYFGYIAGKDK